MFRSMALLPQAHDVDVRGGLAAQHLARRRPISSSLAACLRRRRWSSAPILSHLYPPYAHPPVVALRGCAAAAAASCTDDSNAKNPIPIPLSARVRVLSRFPPPLRRRHRRACDSAWTGVVAAAAPAQRGGGGGVSCLCCAAVSSALRFPFVFAWSLSPINCSLALLHGGGNLPFLFFFRISGDYACLIPPGLLRSVAKISWWSY